MKILVGNERGKEEEIMDTQPLLNLYLSFDIEADGSAPGVNGSMLSFGFAGFTLDGNLEFEFERNLLPVEGYGMTKNAMEFWSENQEAWQYLMQNRIPAEQAMQELKEAIETLKTKYKMTLVAWPASYDWQWINHYFWKFCGINPLGYSARCIGTYGQGSNTLSVPAIKDNKRYPRLTHRAVDDAKHQGFCFINMLRHNLGFKILE